MILSAVLDSVAGVALDEMVAVDVGLRKEK